MTSSSPRSPHSVVLAALASAALVLLLQASHSPARAGTDGSLTIAEYRSLIADCRRATTANRKRGGARIAALQMRLAAVRTVTMPDGNPVAVDPAPLIEALSAEARGTEMSERPATLESLLLSGAILLRNGDPEEQAHSILSAPEFHYEHTRNPASKTPAWWLHFTQWLKGIVERIGDWIDRFFRNLQPSTLPKFAGAPGLAQFLEFLLFFLLGVAALVGCYLLGRAAIDRGWLSAIQRRRRRESGDTADPDLTGDAIVDPLGTAKMLAARGAYRDAVRLSYIASLRRLEGSGLLLLEPNRTNWEYQRALRRRSRGAHDTLLPATRLFDRVWYGRRPATEREFAAMIAVHDALPVLPRTDTPGDGAAIDLREEEALRP